MKFSGTIISELTKIPTLTAAGDFQLHKVHLVRAGCPVSLLSTRANRMADMPIVIACNREKHGFVESTNYYPRAVVVAGADQRSRLLADSILASWAWVENGSMDVRDEAIGSNEILQKVTSELSAKYVGRAVGLPSQETPWIAELYPFNNYAVFGYKGQKYGQDYQLDGGRNVILAGTPVKLDSIAACGMAMGLHGTNVGKLPLNQTGARYAFAPVPGNNQTATHGGNNSELVTQIVRNWTNINEAASMYVNAVKHGLYSPMQPAFAPVALPKDGKLTTAIASRGISPADFAIWSEQAQKKDTKLDDGTEIHRKHFAYVGSRTDPSTWKLRIDNPTRAMAALAVVHQMHDIPAAKKDVVIHRISKALNRKSTAVGVVAR